MKPHATRTIPDNFIPSNLASCNITSTTKTKLVSFISLDYKKRNVTQKYKIYACSKIVDLQMIQIVMEKIVKKLES